MLSSRPSTVTKRVPVKHAAKPRATPRNVVKLNAPARTVATSSARPFSLLVLMVLGAGCLTARLAFWGVVEHGRLAAAAFVNRSAFNVQPPLRGQITDASHNILATNIMMSEVFAVPKEIKLPGRTAHLVAPIIGWPEKKLEQTLTGDSGYVRLVPAVQQSVSRQIRDLALPGIGLSPVTRRYYLNGPLQAQTIGYTDGANKGWYGIEGRYNSLLAGSAGLRSVLKDTAGNDIKIAGGSGTPARDGANLQLSIDPTVQGLAENELKIAVKKHRADGGTVIVMSPRTGYVLGMASTPGFDANQYARTANVNPGLFVNPATQMDYEPGSTFKVITMGAGLDSGVITPSSTVYDTGHFQAAPGVILHNWNLSGWGLENMTQVLQHSANVGASWVAQRLGTDTFYRYLKNFGLDRPTGVDLQGEIGSQLPLPGQKRWTIVNLYTNSFGQGISITPLQMITAVSAVANGGVLMRPQVVRSITYRGRVISRPPVTVRRVISSQTAHTLTDMLVHSAVGGEAQLGLVHGYNIAAKTGTANIAGTDGRYIQNATIASIVGYAPAYNPRFVTLVIIKHPRDTPWGSMAAAPVLKDLFQELFLHYQIPPSAHPVY